MYSSLSDSGQGVWFFSWNTDVALYLFVFVILRPRVANEESQGARVLATELWNKNRTWNKAIEQPPFATAGWMESLWVSVFHFPFSRTCLPLLGFPFGRNLPFPLLLLNDPLLFTPPLSPRKLRLVTIPTAGSICSYSLVIFRANPRIFSDKSFLVCTRISRTRGWHADKERHFVLNFMRS